MNKKSLFKKMVIYLGVFSVLFFSCSVGAENQLYYSSGYGLSLPVKSVQVGDTFSKLNNKNLNIRLLQNSIEQGSVVANDIYFGADTSLENSIKIFEEGKNLLEINLVNSLKLVDDKKSYLDTFILTIEDLGELLSTTKKQIDSKLVNLKSKEDYLEERVSELEEKILNDFKSLRWQNISSDLQDDFFELRGNYLNTSTYRKLYERLSKGYENMIEATVSYESEIKANYEVLISGNRVVRFKDFRLDLVSVENQ